jgi:hypothetical protein
MFQALLAHPQEAIHKRHLVYCVRVVSVGYTRIGVAPVLMKLIFQKPTPPPLLLHTHARTHTLYIYIYIYIFDDEWAICQWRGIDVIRNKRFYTSRVCSKLLSRRISCVKLISLNASVERWHYCRLTDYHPLLRQPTTGWVCEPIRPNHLYCTKALWIVYWNWVYWCGDRRIIANCYRSQRIGTFVPSHTYLAVRDGCLLSYLNGIIMGCWPFPFELFLPPTYFPALIYFGRERGWRITFNYPTVLKEKNRNRNSTTCAICWLKSVLHEENHNVGRIPILWFSCFRHFSSCSAEFSQQIAHVVLFLFLFFSFKIVG